LKASIHALHWRDDKMSIGEGPVTQAVIVEADLQFSLPELSRACGVELALLESLVHEGVLTPQGDHPTQWRFEGSALPRARTAARLLLDLDLSASGAALVLELLDEIDALKSQLRRLGGQPPF
jgi:chaperone modulatory protein CbpM